MISITSKQKYPLNLAVGNKLPFEIAETNPPHRLDQCGGTNERMSRG